MTGTSQSAPLVWMPDLQFAVPGDVKTECSAISHMGPFFLFLAIPRFTTSAGALVLPGFPPALAEVGRAIAIFDGEPRVARSPLLVRGASRVVFAPRITAASFQSGRHVEVYIGPMDADWSRVPWDIRRP